MIANNLEGYLKRHENNNELVKERKKVRDYITKQENTIITPSHEELIILKTLLRNLKELNEDTFKIHDELDNLEERKEYVTAKAYQLEHNTLQQRLDNTNYQAYRIKRQIRIKLKKYHEFVAKVPIVPGGRVFKEETHYYKKIHNNVLDIVHELEGTRSYGEELMIKYKEVYQDNYPKELQK